MGPGIDVFQAMKGEKGITAVSVTEGLGEELTDDSFNPWSTADSVLMIGPGSCFLTLRLFSRRSGYLCAEQRIWRSKSVLVASVVRDGEGVNRQYPVV
ncbi:hypothetical protein JZ751_022237 [Albula glossodonta]|uniref:Uncharacterized protein n=1 Tax=Albula glossodonta TaxID=121402 RepID=A0A8T2NIS9_9TELE|nr:hypothetical protein JZ751_022237 [Albula glossodonta]